MFSPANNSAWSPADRADLRAQYSAWSPADLRALLGMVSRRSRRFAQTYYFEMVDTMQLGTNMGPRKSSAAGMLNTKWVVRPRPACYAFDIQYYSA